MVKIIIQGRFESREGDPIVGAAIHTMFLGDPPTGVGTSFDIERAPTITNDRGEFKVVIQNPDERFRLQNPPGAWREGCFFVLGVKNARTLGYTVESGEQLAETATVLVALPTADVVGSVTDEDRQPVEGAHVEASHYYFRLERGPYPQACVNFWLSRPSLEPGRSREKIVELTGQTDRVGSFVLRDVPLAIGEIGVTVSRPDRALLEFRYDPSSTLPPLVMRAGASVSVRICSPDGIPMQGFRLSLSGKPDGAPDPRDVIGAAFQAACFLHRFDQTNEDGACSFDRLPPGSYVVRYCGGPPCPLALPAIPVEDLALGERREIDVRAVGGSILTGTVTEVETGDPIWQAEVRYQSPHYPRTGSTIQATYTDQHGRYSTDTALAPGPLDVMVSAWFEGKRVGRHCQVVIGPELRTEVDFTLSFKGNQ